MDKQAISQLLILNHKALISEIDELSDEDFVRKPGAKWTAGQQLEHIIKSVKRTDMAYGLPLFVLKMKFGLSNRPSRSYDELVKKYLMRLEKNKDYTMPKAFAPDEVPLKRKQKSLDKLQKLIKKLTGRVARISEEELDTYILPHPVLGKLTLREMLYFTAYHASHHERQVHENLKNY